MVFQHYIANQNTRLLVCVVVNHADMPRIHYRVSDENTLKGVVNCQNSRDKGPPEGNSARG